MKKVLIVLAVLAAAIVVAGLVLPKEMRIERSIEVNRPSAEVFASIRSIKSNQTWNPWMKMDPNIVTSYAGVDGTVGSSSSWKGNSKVGEGEQQITEIVEGEKIVSELRFKKPMEGIATTWLVTEPISATQTRVHWGFTSQSKFPFNILCAIMGGKGQMVKVFDQGLADLKAILEK